MKQVVICGTCDGHGFVNRRELEDYHQGIYTESVEVCPQCKGSGRVQVETIITVTPYTPEEL